MSSIHPVCLTGPRDWPREGAVNVVIANLSDAWGHRLRLGFGDADGVDLFAWRHCRAWGIPFGRYEARWEQLGRAAGVLRNGEMLDGERPAEVRAFCYEGAVPAGRQVMTWAEILRGILNRHEAHGDRVGTAPRHLDALFTPTRGTGDCIRQALLRGIPVTVHDPWGQPVMTIAPVTGNGLGQAALPGLGKEG